MVVRVVVAAREACSPRPLRGSAAQPGCAPRWLLAAVLQDRVAGSARRPSVPLYAAADRVACRVSPTRPATDPKRSRSIARSSRPHGRGRLSDRRSTPRGSLQGSQSTIARPRARQRIPPRTRRHPRRISRCSRRGAPRRICEGTNDHPRELELRAVVHRTSHLKLRPTRPMYAAHLARCHVMLSRRPAVADTRDLDSLDSSSVLS